MYRERTQRWKRNRWRDSQYATYSNCANSLFQSFRFGLKRRKLAETHSLLPHPLKSSASLLAGLPVPNPRDMRHLLYSSLLSIFSSHCHVICWSIYGSPYFVEGTGNRTRRGRGKLVIDDAWPIQRSLLSWIRCDRIFYEPVHNTRFLTCAFIPSNPNQIVQRSTKTVL